MTTQTEISWSRWVTHVHPLGTGEAIGLEQYVPDYVPDRMTEYMTATEALELADFIYANFKEQE